MSDNNSDLALAFPTCVRDDALQMASTFPSPVWKTEPFSVCVGSETVLIPYRVYHDPALINLKRLIPSQVELLDCLLTRHHSGFIRERHLENIIRSDREWIPAFVFQLVGEYVIEIWMRYARSSTTWIPNFTEDS